VRLRRVVTAIVLVLGTVLLGLSMRRHPSESSFYWLVLTLAAVWVIGAFASGPLHLGVICWRGRNRRPVVVGSIVGLLLGGVFVAGGLIAREIPVISALATRVLRFADEGTWPLIIAVALLGAIAEELFYRGALYTVLVQRNPVITSTAVYGGATLATGYVILALAATVLGAVCAFERRLTGGVLAPMLTHFVWSLVVLLWLPSVFGL
jgi:membrane protease YdiL (CAAX protease family)